MFLPQPTTEPEQEPKEIDEEDEFIRCYQFTKFDIDQGENKLQRAFDKIRQIDKPVDIKLQTIHNEEILSLPTFLDLPDEKIHQTKYFNATMAIGQLLCFINSLDITKIDQFDQFQTSFMAELQKESEDRHLPFIHVLILVFALRKQQIFSKFDMSSSNNQKEKKIIDSEKKSIENYITGLAEKYKENPNDSEQLKFLKLLLRAKNLNRADSNKSEFEKIYGTFEFLSTRILVQQLLVQSRAFKACVEIVAKAILVPLLIPFPQAKKSDSMFLQSIISYEKLNTKIPNELPSLVFFRTVVNLYDDAELCEMILGPDSKFPDYKKFSDFGSPPFFISYVNFLTSLVRSPELAEKVYQIINQKRNGQPDSHILNFENFFNGLFKHTSDDFTKPDYSDRKLSPEDVLAIEAVLRLLAALFRQNQSYLERFNEMPELREAYFPDKQDQQDHQENKFLICFVNNIFAFVLSAVPTTLKAESLNCLSSLRVNLWRILGESILTQSMVEESLKPNVDFENFKTGVIGDIFTIELKSKVFNIPTAFCNLFASLLLNKEFAPDNNNFAHYHRFIHEIILNNCFKWDFDYPGIKWKLIRAICTVYINLLNRNDWIDLATQLFTTALTNPYFINTFSTLANDPTCPVEVLMAIYKLFLLLLWKENDFLKKSLQSNNSQSPAIVKNILRRESGLIKMLQCTLSHFKNLQIIALELIEFLAIASPPIVQMLLTKQSVSSIPICNGLIKCDEDEEIDPQEVLEKNEKNKDIKLNVRCYLLRMFDRLGSTAFFTRFACGFDQHDPPKSIIQSNLDNGILKPMIGKLIMKETHKHYPIFVEKAFKLLLIECQQDLTIRSVLNLLHSSNIFFESQLRFLSTSLNSSNKAIGILLQLMAIECSNRKRNSSSLKAFDALMSPVLNNPSQLKIFSFTDRISNNRKSRYILEGIKNITVAYLTSKSFVEYMKSQTNSNWAYLWLDVVFHLLEKVQILTDSKLIERALETCSIITNAILVQKLFGPLNGNDQYLAKLFKFILQTFFLVSESEYQESRTSVYSLLTAILNVIVPNEERKNEFAIFEQNIFRLVLMDTKSQIPILKSAAMNVIESLIEYASPNFFLPLIELLIESSNDDWSMYAISSSTNSAAYCISQKCKLYSKFITTAQRSEYSYSLLNENRIIIIDGLIVKLANRHLWGQLEKILSKPTEREMEIQTATDIFSLYALISCAFKDSDSLRIQLNWFFSQYQTQLQLFIQFDEMLSIPILNLFSAFFKLLSAIPYIEDLKKYNMWNLIPILFKKFANEDEWKDMLHGADQPTILEEAKKITSTMLMSGVFALLNMSESESIFVGPISGEDWKTKKNFKVKEMPLSIITSYVCHLMNSIKSQEQTTRDNDNTEKSVVLACLVIVWQHLNRRRDTGINSEETKLFQEEPFKSYKGNSPLDSLILKRLSQF